MNEGVDGLMTGRLTIWKETMQTIGQKPMILLWGESAHMPREMEAINSIREAEGLYKIHHTHNEFLQILLENGIPGLALFAAFIVLFLRDAYRMITNRTLRFWQRAVPIPALGCLMAETVDITARANGDLPQMTILFLFIGFTAVLAGQTKPKRRMA